MKTLELTPRQTGNIRLMELAQILDDGAPSYYQRYFRLPDDCNSPACALGHWAHHHRDRWVFTPERGPHLHEFEQLGHMPDGEIVIDGRVAQVIVGATVNSALKEFDISSTEYSQLFGIFGCGRAQTAQEAAKYIRAFVRCRLETEAAEVIAA